MFETIICVVIGIIIAPIVLFAGMTAVMLICAFTYTITILLLNTITAIPVMIYEYCMGKKIEKYSGESE